VNKKKGAQRSVHLGIEEKTKVNSFKRAKVKDQSQSGMNA